MFSRSFSFSKKLPSLLTAVIIVFSLFAGGFFTSSVCADDVIFSTFNIEAVQNNPSNIQRVEIVFAQNAKISLLTNYHWNNGRGDIPGFIEIYSADGKRIGQWNATAKPGSGRNNVGWEIYPNIELSAGTYYVVDSNPQTWSANAASGYQPFVEIKGSLIESTAPSAPSQTSVVEWNGHRYERIEESMTWHEAKAYCERRGGHLATVTSKEEQKIIEDLIRGGNKAQYWLGATDENDEGNWRWITGEPFAMMSSGGFDNYQGNEHYLEVYRHNWGDESRLGQWNDINKDNYISGQTSFFSPEHIGLICEYSPDLPQNPNPPAPSNDKPDISNNPANAGEIIFSTFNIEAVQNNPSNIQRVEVVFTQNAKINLLTNYHWNNGQGDIPGFIEIYSADGKKIGQWNATAKPGSGRNNVGWEIYPNIELSAGTYYVVDSNPQTWSANSKSGNTPFVEIRGSLSGPKPTTPPAQPPSKPSAGGPVAIPITDGTQKDKTSAFNGATGVSVNFPNTGAIGYRLYRSETEGDLGISVTDFFITAMNFTDVNVEPNTTYYYTLREVLEEADPLNDKREVPGQIIARWTTKTDGAVGQGFKDPTKTRHFIMLKIEDPKMSVDGIQQEVDPGRGTAPIIVRGRTMVPIRAIVESMGGTMGWKANTREVSLNLDSNTVKMWVDKKELEKNSVKSKVDVPPSIINSRTFVPLRFGAENLDCQIDWINSTKSIVIVWSE